MALKDVEVALHLKRELEVYEANKDRSVLIKALREQFLITRQNSAVEMEKARLKALEVLVDRMDKMSEPMLLKTIASLSDIGGLDLTLLTKNNNVGPMINLQQNVGISMESKNLEGNPIKNTGELLESLEHIANHFRGRTIELKAEPDLKQDNDNTK
jgi:hypothetical protein